MATLRVTSLRGRTAGTSPELPDGAVVTGVTTTGSAIVGAAVTINASGVDAGAGIITATSFVGSGEGLTGVASTDNIITGSATTFTLVLQMLLVGNVNAGVVITTSFEGSGALLTGLPAGFTELDAALFN